MPVFLLALALAAPPDGATLPEGLVEGRLDNGLRWYVLPEDTSDGRVSVRLQVDVGAIDEAPEEEGAAHFLEHVSFETSRDHDLDSRGELMRSMSISMGKQWGASTGFEYTTWYTSVPRSQPEGVHTILEVMADQLMHPRFRAAECAHERDVVLEEMRMRQGTLEHSSSQAMRSLAFAGDLPATRDVGGRTDRVAELDCRTAKRFWAAHYGPERSVLVMVGVADVAAAQQDIEEVFSGWRAGRLAEPKVLRRSTASGLDVYVSLERLATQPEVTLVLPQTAAPTEPDEALAWDAALAILSDRLKRQWYDGDPLLSTPRLNRSGLSPVVETVGLRITPPPGTESQAAVALWREAVRLAQSGVSEAELTLARARLVHAVEARTEHPPSHEIATRLLSQLGGDVQALHPSLRQQHQRDAAARLTTALVQEVFRQQVTTGTGGGVALILPGEAVAPDVAALRAALAAVASESLPAPPDVELKPVYTERPSPRAVQPLPDTSGLDVRSWDLGNGLVVHLKTTTTTPGRVAFDGLGPGASHMLPASQLASAYAIDSLLASSGVGRLSWVERQVLQQTTGATIHPYLNSNHVGIEGQAPTAALDTLLQMIRAFLESPRIDEQALAVTRDHFAMGEAIAETSPETAAGQASMESLTGDRLRWNTNLVPPERIDLEIARGWTRHCFERPPRFELFFAGDIDPAVFESLIATWLATLPAGEARPPAPEEAWSLVKGPVQRDLVVEGTDRAAVQLTWHGTIGRTPADAARAEVLELALQSTLWHMLRQENSGVYHVDVNLGGAADVPDRRFFSVRFVCAPDRAAELAGLATRVAENLHRWEPPAEFLAAIVTTRLEEHEQRLRSAEGWAVALWRAATYGGGMQDLQAGPQALREVRAADVQALAAAMFVPEHRVRVIARPKQ